VGIKKYRLNHAACGSGVVLMAQAPSEGGVRKSGVHWVGADGRLRRPGGTFLGNYLRQIGYSIDPEAAGYAKPYTTNVLHTRGVRSCRAVAQIIVAYILL